MGRWCKYERRFIADQDAMSKAAPASGFLKEGNGCGGAEVRSWPGGTGEEYDFL